VCLRPEADCPMGEQGLIYTQQLSCRSLEAGLKLCMERCDVIVVTGAGTGISTDLEKTKTFRAFLGEFSLIVDAGMTAETEKEQLAFLTAPSWAAISRSLAKRSILWMWRESRSLCLVLGHKQNKRGDAFMYSGGI